MQFINIKDPRAAARELARIIATHLGAGEKVLWLVSGGSNVAVAVGAFHELKKELSPEALGRLTVTLTDERYGLVDHPDSNAKQLEDAGFDFEAVRHIPVLRGVSKEETTARCAAELETAFLAADVVIGQFGMGVDGHIAGVLPNTVGVTSHETVCLYQAGKLIRLSLTLTAIKRNVDVAVLFVFGEAKRQALVRLQRNEFPLAEQPAQILKEIPQALVYTDLDI